MSAFDVAAWDDEDDDNGMVDAAPATTTDAELDALLARCAVAPRAAPPPPPPPHSQPPPPPPPPKHVIASHATTAEMADHAAEPPVELGFLSPYPAPVALPEHFPSKVGGEPIWLLPERLPAQEALCCGQCGRPLRFLLQLYCPRPEVPHAYHRSLMLFCCGGPCLLTPPGWRVLRCNLPEAVPWYEEEQGAWKARGRDQLTAAAAAARSSDGPPSTLQRRTPPPLLPELLVSIDLEGDWRALLSWADAHAEEEAQRLLASYEASEAERLGGAGAEVAAQLRPVTVAVAAPEDDDNVADDEEVEESFYAFQRRTSAHPEQALRYTRSSRAEPLWAGARGRLPSTGPPPCGRCGARRTFEFQLMPQAVCALEAHGVEVTNELASATPSALPGRAHLDEGAASGARSAIADGLDWGVLAVYTCSASCATAVDGAACGYADEFCWHQSL